VRHGSIKWHAEDERSWHASSLHKIEPVEFFVKYATIVYDKGELQHDELYLNNKRVILVEARNGIQPYIIYPHPKFTQILHTEDTKDRATKRIVDKKLQIWSITLPSVNGAASEDRGCLYIQDKTKLIPIECHRASNGSLQMGLSWFWRDDDPHEEDQIDGMRIQASDTRLAPLKSI